MPCGVAANKTVTPASLVTQVRRMRFKNRFTACEPSIAMALPMKSNTTGWTAKIGDDQTSGFPVRNSLEGVPDYELGSYLPKSSRNSMSSGAKTAVLLSPSARPVLHVWKSIRCMTWGFAPPRHYLKWSWWKRSNCPFSGCFWRLLISHQCQWTATSPPNQHLPGTPPSVVVLAQSTFMCFIRLARGLRKGGS